MKKVQMSKVKSQKSERKTKNEKLEMPTSVAEIDSAVADEIKKRQKMELEATLGKLKKLSDLVKARRRIAQLLTKKREVEGRNKQK